MKANRSARWIVRIRGIAIRLALAGMVGVALFLGETLAARVGQTTASQIQGPQAPNGSLADLVAAGW
jgi:hypothetical protein